MATPRLSARERVALAMSHREADRIPRFDSFWGETLAQWRDEGLGASENVEEVFGFDIRGVGWSNMQARLNATEVIEENEQWISRRDGNGAILRYWKGRSGTPEHVAFSVDTRDKWEALKRDMRAVPPGARINPDTVKWAEQARARDLYLVWQGVECFEIAKDIFGHETLCLTMAEDPEWAADIFSTLTDQALSVLNEYEKQGVKFDGGWIYGDIAFNTAPFFSPTMYREQIQECHCRQVRWFKDRGCHVIYHTDGNFTPILPALIETGIDCFQPLEAKAGMDVRTLKAQYAGKVAFMGNIDAMVLLTNDRARIEEEVAAKIPVAMKGGGYIYHSDHSIPPGVTWETYKFLMELVERYGRFQ